MLPTRLTVWLFAVGLLPLLAGVGYSLISDPGPAFTTTLFLLVFAYDAGILLLFVTDGLRARRGFLLRATRERPGEPRPSAGPCPGPRRAACRFLRGPRAP
jgi:hypothetical protein